jgi:hypothetical protein
MLLCSIADVRARSDSTIEDDPLGALIESVSDYIEDYVGMWLAPRPDPPSATTTLLFDVERTASTLRLTQRGRLTGIRTLTSLGVASVSQAEAGGTYTSVTPASVLLRPRPSIEGPATSLTLLAGWFWRGFNTVQVAGSFGPAVVSSRAREAAIQLAMLTLSYNPGLGQLTIGSWSESYVNNSVWNVGKETEMILASLPRQAAV